MNAIKMLKQQHERCEDCSRSSKTPSRRERAEDLRTDRRCAGGARHDRGEALLSRGEGEADRGHPARVGRGAPGDQARDRRSAGDDGRRRELRGEGEGAAGGRRAPRRGGAGRAVPEGARSCSTRRRWRRSAKRCRRPRTSSSARATRARRSRARPTPPRPSEARRAAPRSAPRRRRSRSSSLDRGGETGDRAVRRHAQRPCAISGVGSQ